MLTVKTGNLFDCKKLDRIIAHGCNSKGVMGSGFALEIRNRFPEAYLTYVREHKIKPLELGEVVWKECSDGTIIANVITQEFYGRDKNCVYVDYDAVYTGLIQVSAMNIIRYKNLKEIHLPMIGGGLANGDHDRLLNIYNDAFSHTKAILWLKE